MVKRKILYIAIPIIGTLIGLMVLLYWPIINEFSTTDRVTQNTPDRKSIYSQIDYSKKNSYEVKPESRELRQIFWIPDWGFEQGFDSLKKNYQYIDSVSPVWYYLNKDGSTKSNKVGLNQLRSYTKEKGIEMIPSIASFDPDEFHNILKDESTISNHVDYLFNEATSNDYDGIDLDYESIYFDDQPAFFKLVRELSKKLHGADKKLTIAVISKWTQNNPHLSLSQTRRVQNWIALEPYFDEIRIMSYDYTSPYSKSPGPVSPLDWQEAILRYATRNIPSAKIYLGSNLYGYVWEYKAGNGSYSSYNELELAEDKQSYSLTTSQLKNRFNIYRGQTNDEYSTGEFVFTYKKDGKTWIAFSNNRASQKDRNNLAKKYGIAGIAYWKLGDEDSDIITQP